jgi:NTP pyrophosphatase (non-canonical NTP hydrolase)
MEFQQLVERALQIRAQYAELEQSRYGRSWTNDEIALGFVGDVGDLAKLVIAHNGVRAIPDAHDKLAHELSDCLWSIIVLAHNYDIDLEAAFLATMDDLSQHIDNTLNRSDRAP